MHPLVDMDKRVLTYWDVAQLQDLLNTQADKHNPNWREIRTIEDFRLAAMVEFGELVSSMPWKWWKTSYASIDEWHLKMEAIDILHFLMSISLMQGIPAKDCNRHLCEREIFHEEQYDMIFNETITQANRVGLSKVQTVLQREVIDYNAIDYILRVCGLSDLEVSAMYVAKMQLNKIRWDNDYGSEEYKKFISPDGEKLFDDNQLLQQTVVDFINDDTALLSSIPTLVMNVMNNALAK